LPGGSIRSFRWSRALDAGPRPTLSEPGLRESALAVLLDGPPVPGDRVPPAGEEELDVFPADVVREDAERAEGL